MKNGSAERSSDWLEYRVCRGSVVQIHPLIPSNGLGAMTAASTHIQPRR